MYHVASCITWCPVPSRPVSSRPVPSRPVLSRPVLSSYLMLWSSCAVPCHARCHATLWAMPCAVPCHAVLCHAMPCYACIPLSQKTDSIYHHHHHHHHHPEGVVSRSFCLNSSIFAVSEFVARRWWCIGSLFPLSQARNVAV